MAKYDDAYFENLTKEANVIYRCLYLNEINEMSIMMHIKNILT